MPKVEMIYTYIHLHHFTLAQIEAVHDLFEFLPIEDSCVPRLEMIYTYQHLHHFALAQIEAVHDLFEFLPIEDSCVPYVKIIHEYTYINICIISRSLTLRPFMTFLLNSCLSRTHSVCVCMRVCVCVCVCVCDSLTRMSESKAAFE